MHCCFLVQLNSWNITWSGNVIPTINLWFHEIYLLNWQNIRSECTPMMYIHLHVVWSDFMKLITCQLVYKWALFTSWTLCWIIFSKATKKQKYPLILIEIQSKISDLKEHCVCVFSVRQKNMQNFLLIKMHLKQSEKKNILQKGDLVLLFSFFFWANSDN